MVRPRNAGWRKPSAIGKRAFVSRSIVPARAAMWRAQRNARLRRRNVRTAGFLGIETKFYDTYVTATNLVATTAGAEVDPAANASCLNAITQGDGESARDGKRCILKSVQVNGLLQCAVKSDQADALNGIAVRVALVWDKQTNGAQLNSEDVFKDGAGMDGLSLRNMQYASRFKVLWSRMIKMFPCNSHTDGANTGSVAFPSVPFSIYKRVNIPVNFTGTTEDIANITDNSLHMIAIANSTTPGPNISYQARVRFVG